MAYTVVKTLTDEDGTLHADSTSWTDKFGLMGLGRDDINGHITTDGTSTVTLTRIFASESSWMDYQTEIYSKRGTHTFTSILTGEEQD
jgi:hypothetical protein